MISTQAQEFADMMRKMKNESGDREDTPEGVLATRKMLDERWNSMPIPENVTLTKVDSAKVKGEMIIYDDKDEQKLKGHILLFIHGGGFMTGSVLSRRALCLGIIKNAKMDAFSVAYSQWPEAVHPAALNDCLAAYDWLLDKGYDSDKIHFFGESAGAMLTLTTILYLKDHNKPLPGSACVFSPVGGFGTPLESHKEREQRDPMISFKSVIPYYGETKELDSPYLSPRYGNYKGFPKLQIHVGTEEVLFDDARLIEKLCKDAGVDVSLRIWEGLFHVFVLFPCPETEIALKEIGEFLREE